MHRRLIDHCTIRKIKKHHIEQQQKDVAEGLTIQTQQKHV